VQFLKSLFCLYGVDNRTRFFAICAAAYVLFIMLISAFTGNAFVSLTILALFIPILAFTSLRRLKDAKINRNWLFLPNLLFVLTALIIIFSEQNSSYYLLIIPALCFAVLLTYPSVNKKNSLPLNYILGYFGPIDMSEYQQTTHQGKQAKCRIEPSLVSSNSIEENPVENSSVNINSESLSSDGQAVWQDCETTSPYGQCEQKTDLGEIIRVTLVNNRKAQLAIAILLAITLISACASWLMNKSSNGEALQTSQEAAKLMVNTQYILERKHPLEMPDNFSLFLSQHQGITINWQADNVSTPLLWSQSTAQGEDSCKQISFNKGNPIRTLMVTVENGTAVANGVSYVGS